MITSIQIIPVVGSPLELNTLDYPISQDFDPEIEYEDEKYKKALVPGEWPAYVPQGALYLTIIGDIVGRDPAQPTVDYMNKRTALQNALRPAENVDGILTTRHHGTLRLRMDGWASTADNDFVTVSLSMPLTTEYVSVSEYRWTAKFPRPYFLNGATRFYIA